MNYRILYGFVGTEVALLACGLTKQQRVPPVDIDRAVARVNEFQRDPKRFGFSEAE